MGCCMTNSNIGTNQIENKNKPIPSSEKLKKITEISPPELQRFKLQRTGLWFDTDCNSQASKELRNFIESNVDEGCFYLCDTPQKFKTDIEKILKEGSEDFFIISSGQRIKEIIDQIEGIAPSEKLRLLFVGIYCSNVDSYLHLTYEYDYIQFVENDTKKLKEQIEMFRRYQNQADQDSLWFQIIESNIFQKKNCELFHLFNKQLYSLIQLNMESNHADWKTLLLNQIYNQMIKFFRRKDINGQGIFHAYFPHQFLCIFDLLKLYTLETDLYLELNKTLSHMNISQIKNFSFLMRGMLQAFYQLRSTHKLLINNDSSFSSLSSSSQSFIQLYRGIQVQDLKKYEALSATSSLIFHSFVSSSKIKNISKIQKSDLLFQIEVWKHHLKFLSFSQNQNQDYLLSPLEIKNFSFYKDEEEILFPPMWVFKVKRPLYFDGKQYILELETVIEIDYSRWLGDQQCAFFSQNLQDTIEHDIVACPDSYCGQSYINEQEEKEWSYNNQYEQNKNYSIQSHLEIYKNEEQKFQINSKYYLIEQQENLMDLCSSYIIIENQPKYLVEDDYQEVEEEDEGKNENNSFENPQNLESSYISYKSHNRVDYKHQAYNQISNSQKISYISESQLENLKSNDSYLNSNNFKMNESVEKESDQEIDEEDYENQQIQSSFQINQQKFNSKNSNFENNSNEYWVDENPE